ncbi:MAG TPA: TerC family protein [Polyangia bacterium]
MTSVGSPIVWAVFALIVVGALAIDLGLFHRKAHVVKMREAAMWTAIWAALALSFNGWIYYRFGGVKAAEFLQGWLLEYALSVDNIFVFLVVFRYFRVPADQLHRVLFWGILGAVISRGIFIGLGAVLIQRFHWVMYILGAFLVYTSIKILFDKEGDVDPERNPALRIFRRFVPTTTEYHGQKFLVRLNGRMTATPLLVVLVVVEMTDVMFAVDSIPAIFGVTTDVFIVFSSNIFAILGLLSLFFLIEGLVAKLRYLKAGVALILAFIGVKILIESIYKIPVAVSLSVLAGILATATIMSLIFPPPAAEHVPDVEKVVPPPDPGGRGSSPPIAGP